MVFQPGYVVHPGDGPVLACLADEQHRPLPADVDSRAIAELDGSDDACVEFRERGAVTSHGQRKWRRVAVGGGSGAEAWSVMEVARGRRFSAFLLPTRITV